MSTPNDPHSSRFGKQRRTQIKQATFLDRHYRTLHHVGLVLGLSIFFGPFIYKYLTRPPLEKLEYHPQMGPKLDYEKLQKQINDKWM